MPTEENQNILLYDGYCQFCQRSVALLRRLDWLRRVTYRDARDNAAIPAVDPPLDRARLLEEMHLVTKNRRVYHGFHVFRWLAWRLPLTWLLAPFLYVPGVLPLGQRLYLWVARHRFQLVPCSHGACQLPAHRPKSSP